MYTTIEKLPNSIRISLTNEGRVELTDLKKDDTLSPNDIFVRLIEYHLCNGWELVSPENIGALTSSLILSDDYSILDESSNIFEYEYHAAYWFPEYQVRSELKDMEQYGFVEFAKVAM